MRSVRISFTKHYLTFVLSTSVLFLCIVLGFSTIVLAGPGSKSEQRYTIFDAPNATYTLASNVNDAGIVTGYFFEASGRIRGFEREEGGRIVVIDAIPGAKETEAAGTNTRGETAGISEASKSFIRNKRGDITLFSAPNSEWTFATAINNRGEITGSFSDKTDPLHHGFVRDPGGQITVFDVPNGHDVKASAINSKGDTAGIFYDVTGRRRPFIRDRDGNFKVPAIQNEVAEVAGINDRGDIAGYYVDQEGNVLGFLLPRSGAPVNLNVPSPEVTGVNNRDEVVGIFEDPTRDGKTCGFVWSPPGRFTVLDVPNTTATYAYSINNRGEISGGFDVAGLGSKRRAFVYRIGPEH